MLKMANLSQAIRGVRVGGTPVFELPRRLLEELGLLGCQVVVKDETQNPTGTLKARSAWAMLLQAAEKGKLRPTTTVVEASSGSTALALAYVALQIDLRCLFFVPAHISAEKLRRIQGFTNAEVRTINGSSEDARVAARAWVEDHGDLETFYVDQYDNLGNPASHVWTTAPEIAEQVERVQMVVAGLGTGGTAHGLKWYFAGTGIRIVGVQPCCKDHFLDGLKHYPTLMPREVPRVAALEALDDLVFVSSTEGHQMVRTMARHGLRFGPSSGAVLAAAIRLHRSKGLPAGTVVLIFADGLDRYATKYPDLIEESTVLTAD